MFAREDLETLLELHRRAYALVLWLDSSLRTGALPLEEVRLALDGTRSTLKWLRRHLHSSPRASR